MCRKAERNLNGLSLKTKAENFLFEHVRTFVRESARMQLPFWTEILTFYKYLNQSQNFWQVKILELFFDWLKYRRKIMYIDVFGFGTIFSLVKAHTNMYILTTNSILCSSL